MYSNLSFTNRRPSMVLLSGTLDIFSHCCRIVLLEKDVDCEIQYVTASDDPSVIGEHNPYGETPTLVDRDVALYDMCVIIEYLDERFPHPPLMPVDPITRAKTRLTVSRLSRDWLKPISALGETVSPQPSPELQKSLHDGLVSLSSIFTDQPFFLGTDFSLVDAYFAALLWRLPVLGIELPRLADPLTRYGASLFQRPTFHESLSELEAELQ